jgi:hypothetical protein
MLSFSPDDLFLLTSAVDNEVRQYTALDGRLNLVYEIPKLNRTDNYTRSYFVNGGVAQSCAVSCGVHQHSNGVVVCRRRDADGVL